MYAFVGIFGSDGMGKWGDDDDDDDYWGKGKGRKDDYDYADDAEETKISGEFMMAQVREKDLMMFMEMSGQEAVQSQDDIPLSTLIPAFLTSELKTAFTIGFLIYIPFVIIDLVVASVLMSMGMMMLSPMMISMPFKLLLFVLVDGWGLITGSLVSTFG